MDSGVYLFAFRLRSGGPLRVGALGELRLRQGLYAYVGSARRALHRRVGRHCRKRKPRRWHIDHLAHRAEPLWVAVWTWVPGRECRIGGLIEELGLGARAAARFGSSDCRCGGHLFALRDARATDIARTLSEALDERAHVAAL
jgi:Uri superfamily endonuclease